MATVAALAEIKSNSPRSPCELYQERARLCLISQRAVGVGFIARDKAGERGQARVASVELLRSRAWHHIVTCIGPPR
eukprot:496048-Rhodomonas_salina.1